MGLVDQRRAGQRGTRGSARGGIAIVAGHELQCARGREIAPQPFSQRPRVAGVAAGDRCSQVRYASPDVALGVALAQAWQSSDGPQHAFRVLTRLAHARARRTFAAHERLGAGS